MVSQLVPSRSDGKKHLLDLRVADADQERFFQATRTIAIFHARRQTVQQTLLDELVSAWGRDLTASIVSAVRDRDFGAIRFRNEHRPMNAYELARLTIALGCLCGRPYAPLYRGACLTRIQLQHRDPSVIPLHQQSPYRPAPLHTDEHGYDDVRDDYLILTCVVRENCTAGDSILLHLDEWEERDQFLCSPYALRPVPFVFAPQGASPRDAPPSVALDVRERPLFWIEDGRLCIRLSPWNMQLCDEGHVAYVDQVRSSLSRSREILRFSLEPGDFYMVNNHSWLHGHEPFEVHPGFLRLLFSVRGQFVESNENG